MLYYASGHYASGHYASGHANHEAVSIENIHASVKEAEASF